MDTSAVRLPYVRSPRLSLRRLWALDVPGHSNGFAASPLILPNASVTRNVAVAVFWRPTIQQR